MFRKEPTIKFLSTIPGIEEIKESTPKPAVKFLPEWWKKTKLIKSFPIDYDDVINDKVFAGNVKSCPSFPDYFSQGYILPMWTDTILRYDRNTSAWSWNTPNESFQWTVHSHRQYLDNVDHTHMGNSAKVVFKAICPWRIITPPGYSVLQLPMFYHFNNDFTVLPGIIDTDIHSEINQQVLYLSDEPEIFIKRGTPIAQYIPFRREKLDAEIRAANEKEKKIFAKHDVNLSTKFPGLRAYSNLKKERDSKK